MEASTGPNHDEQQQKLWLAQWTVELVVEQGYSGDLVSSPLYHQVAVREFPLVLAGAYPAKLQDSGESVSRQYAVDLAKVNLG